MVSRTVRVLRWTWLSGVLAAAACTSQGTSPDETADDTNCVTDQECSRGLCINGTCTVLVTDAGGMASSSSSSGTASSGSGGSSSSSGTDGGTGPVLVTTPDMGPIEFGASRLGVAVERTVLVENTGASVLQLLQAGVRTLGDGGSVAGFQVSVPGGLPANVAPAAQLGLRIVFTPESAQPVNAVLVLASNAVNGPVHELPLVASFKGSPTLELRTIATDGTTATSTVDLGAVPVGQPQVTTVYVVNNGAEGSAVQITEVALVTLPDDTVSVANPLGVRSLSAFPGTCTTAAACSPLADACTNGLCMRAGSPLDAQPIDITLAPPRAGNHTNNLRIRGVSGTGDAVELTVSLSGTGLVGALYANPDPVVFGETFVTYGKTLTVQIHNAGAAPVTIQSLGLQTGSLFSLETPGQTAPYTVAPAGMLAVEVSFNPTGVGAAGDTLFVTPAVADPLSVTVQGTGALAPVVGSNGPVAFGNRQAGAVHRLDLEINNSGAGPLAVGTLRVEPATAPFSVTPSTLAAAVVPAGMATVQILYAPAAASQTPDAAELIIPSNDPVTPELHVPLTGRAIGPIATLSGAALVDFGTVRVGTSAMPRTVGLLNTGIGPLDVGGTPIVQDSGGATLTDYTVQPSRALPTQISDNALDRLDFSVSFAPVAAGARSGMFAVTTSDPARPTVAVTVLGQGLVCSPNHVTYPPSVIDRCEGACDVDWRDCNTSQQTDGCEINIATTPAHCGGCSQGCSANNITPACSGGNCTGTCAMDYLDCNTDKRTDGCEVFRLNDPLHCGNCTTVCGVNEECVGGICAPLCTVILNELATQGAGASDEFVELFNPCPATFNLRLWKVSYRSSGNNNGADPYAFPDADVLLAPGGFYLMGKGTFASGADDVLVSSSGMASAGGGIALHDALGTIVDSVAYGTAVGTHNYAEGGTVAAHPGSTRTLRRLPNGTDTQNSLADWQPSASAGDATPGAPNL